jgi:crossover junction endodeoxyribonuclease RuvC
MAGEESLMKPVAYIGADPGLSGAVALYVPGASTPHVEVFDMPTYEIDGKRQMDMRSLATIMNEWAKAYAVKITMVERVSAMPDQGVTSSFNFGFSAGALQQSIASAGLPMTLISPATWKSILGLRGGKENKDMSRQLASRLFPTHSQLWARKKDDGRAEAVLLAYYGSKLP